MEKEGSRLKSLLIIDDDKIVRKFLDKHLRDEFEIHQAENGELGLKAAMDLKPSAILLDVQMPGMNGYEVCDQIKQNAETAEIPVIFLSGRSSVRERMLGYEVGGDDYIVKPCEPEELKAKIGILLKFADQQAGLQDAFKEAHQTAIVAMAGNSELGQALSFAQQSFCIRSYNVLAERFLRSATVSGSIAVCNSIPNRATCFFRQMAKLSPWKRN